MRKKFVAIVAVLALISVSMIPALAHGSHRNRTKYVSYSVCSTESCVLTGTHSHNGKYYYAHYYGDGHNYHDYCDIEDCTIAGYHEHDGLYHFGHAAGDGHDYHGYCGVVDCTLTGYHEHNGSYCFGHTANDGHNYHHGGRGHH